MEQRALIDNEELGMEEVIVRSITVEEGAVVDGGATMGDEGGALVDETMETRNLGRKDPRSGWQQ